MGVHVVLGAHFWVAVKIKQVHLTLSFPCTSPWYKYGSRPVILLSWYLAREWVTSHLLKAVRAAPWVRSLRGANQCSPHMGHLKMAVGRDRSLRALFTTLGRGPLSQIWLYQVITQMQAFTGSL